MEFIGTVCSQEIHMSILIRGIKEKNKSNITIDANSGIDLITFLNNIVLCEITIGQQVNINSYKKDNKGDKLTIFHCILVCLQYAIFSATYLLIQCLFWPKIRILMTLFIIHSPFKEFTKVSYSFNFCYSGKILFCNTISI